MLLIVILNVVLAVAVVSVMVALHTKAIVTGDVHQRRVMARERRPVRRPEPRPAPPPQPRPAGTRTTRQPVGSAV